MACFFFDISSVKWKTVPGMKKRMEVFFEVVIISLYTNESYYCSYY